MNEINLKSSNNGIWIGKDATIAIIDEFRIEFFRIKKDTIISVFHHHIYGILGVVYGFGTNSNAYSFVAAVEPYSKKMFNNSAKAENYIQNHSTDKIRIEKKELIYTMYDGTEFLLFLAEKINMKDFYKKNEIDYNLSVEKRMALWGVEKSFEFSNGYIEAQINTQKYSILFSFSITEDWVYCRVGQNGFCKKGRAMLATTCIRKNETRMIEDNLLAIKDYKPNEDWFVTSGCAFPKDGGWYWAIKEITDDVIYLQGCAGEVYEIHRKK